MLLARDPNLLPIDEIKSDKKKKTKKKHFLFFLSIYLQSLAMLYQIC